MARLTVLSEGTEKKAFEINGMVSIGRAFDNTICIPDKKVSRYQAIIEKQADGYYLSDLGSVNGTSIGEEKISAKRKLKHGEVIDIGGAGKIEFFAEPANLNAGTDASVAEPPKPEIVNGSEPLETTIPANANQAIGGNTKPKKSPGLMIAFIAIPVLLFATIGVLIFANSDKKIENKNQLPLIATNNDPTTNSNDSLEPDTIEQSGKTTIPTIPDTTLNTDATSGSSISLDEIRLMCAQLAFNITGKRPGAFDRDFLILVDRFTRDYLDVRVDERVCRNIGVACNDKNLPVQLGLVLAMQRSKFKSLKNIQSPAASDTTPVGFFLMPKAIAKGYISSKENEEALLNPDRATEIGVAYLKEVVDKFRFGKEDFPFAIAYFGSEIGSIGEGTVKLDETFADERARQNFWKIMKSRQVPLPANAMENVARFFAAGIVGENPKRFNLSRNPLSQF
ncbi:MAG: FHA domain-containing protein [Acidobacteriota bacterium]